jgi:hypothetical protein
MCGSGAVSGALILIALLACSSSQEKKGALKCDSSGVPFSGQEVAGTTWLTESKTDVERYEFDGRGYVATSMGKVGGAVTGPILEWHVDQCGRLRLDVGKGRPLFTMRKISLTGTLVEVDIVRDGHNERRRSIFRIVTASKPVTVQAAHS